MERSRRLASARLSPVGKPTKVNGTRAMRPSISRRDVERQTAPLRSKSRLEFSARSYQKFATCPRGSVRRRHGRMRLQLRGEIHRAARSQPALHFDVIHMRKSSNASASQRGGGGRSPSLVRKSDPSGVIKAPHRINALRRPRRRLRNVLRPRDRPWWPPFRRVFSKKCPRRSSAVSTCRRLRCGTAPRRLSCPAGDHVAVQRT